MLCIILYSKAVLFLAGAFMGSSLRRMWALSYLTILCFGFACGQESHIIKRPPEDNLNKHVDLVLPSQPTRTILNQTAHTYCAKEDTESSANKSKENIDVIQPMLQGMLEGGLTPELAVRIALFNNPSLGALFENMAIGYADLIEAGLFVNPDLQLAVQGNFPPNPEDGVRKTFRETIAVTDNLLVPFRQRAAAADLDVIESQLRQAVLDLVRTVQLNWLAVKSLELQIVQQSKIVELSEIAAILAKDQNEVGNVGERNARRREIEFEEQVENLKILHASLEVAAEELTRTLGLFGSEACFRISGDIYWQTDMDLPPVATIEWAALAHRPDIETIRRKIIALAEEAKLKDPWTYADVFTGNTLHKEAGGQLVAESTIYFNNVIYNHGQGQSLKYNGLINQGQLELRAQAVLAASQVREFYKTALIFHSQVVDYDLKILPDYAKQVRSTQGHYNVMTASIYELLDYKRDEILARIKRIVALTSYEESRIELYHASGGSFASVRINL